MTGPSLEQLLSYKRHLEGDAFTRNVLDDAFRRRNLRRWVLLGTTLSATATTIAVKPDKFTFLSNLQLPLRGVGEAVTALPIGGLMAMLLVSLLVMGMSKTINGI
ncbi:hypothetical protein [Microbulbifer litoralis]|uniref:hypothetical protein n=1 Tax=Microbulbifer litoralis TaxID=2933965 RepID=UPI002028F8B0|nr:hypothetical protein [Microbulbifer sp. GX H0434]